LTDDLDEAIAVMPEVTLLGRRALMAGGFALAVSGLLLPLDVIDVAADNRDKRERRRNRRDERRDRRDERRDDPPPGRGFLRDVWFEVHNETWGDLGATRWVFVQLEGWRRMEDFVLPKGRPWYVYTENSTSLALQISQNNSHLTSPKVVLGHNVLFGPETASIARELRPDGTVVGAWVWERPLAVGERVEAANVAVERLPDDDDYKRFRVTLRNDY
jgi:hypothetical protein